MTTDKLVYSSNSSIYTLQDFFCFMGQNEEFTASFLIPDLQRDYVWDTNKIIDLVDTLFKGWPFGQVLIANTGVQTTRFSPRSFFQQIDCFENVHRTFETKFTKDTHIILDGQQRLQSLFLAFAPCSMGIIKDQRNWMKNPYRVKCGKKSSAGFLAVNLDAFFAAFEASKNIEQIDFSSSAKTHVLEWVFKDGYDDSRWWQRNNLPSVLAWDNSGELKYILLKDFWKAPDFEKFMEKQCLNTGKSLPGDPAVLKQLFMHIQNLKNLPVPYTKILSLDECDCGLDEYSELIVSVFTRLNAGGKVLSREDITFAWIKRYWSSSDNQKTAEQTLKKLMNELNELGIPLNSDKLIRNLSNIWCVIENEGKVLDAADFLNGEILKNIAAFLQKNWNIIHDSVITIAKMLKSYNLSWQKQYFSLDGVFCLVTWQLIAKMWLQEHKGNVTDEFNLDSIARYEIDDDVPRFIFGWQWRSASSSYMGKLHQLWQRLKAEGMHINACNLLKECFFSFLQEITVDAKEQINALNRETRSAVSAYTTQLWCWQRLDEKRKILSNKLQQERGGITQGEPNVDHCVAHKFWEDFIAVTLSVHSEEYGNTLSKINQLGNCNILCKSINCSKSDYTMKSFFEKCGLDADNAVALRVPPEMFSPDSGYSIEQILDKIQERTTIIKSDLCQFLDGEKRLCK